MWGGAVRSRTTFVLLMYLAVPVLVLVACTRAGSPPPDLKATEAAIRVALTALAASSRTPVPTPTATPSPPPSPTATVHATGLAPAPQPAPATSTPTPSPSPTATPILYTVQFGDTLARIAQRHGVTVEALAQANNIANPNLIYVGQVLVIPTPSP